MATKMLVKNNKRQNDKRQRGMTLIEILLVLVLLAVVMGVIAVNVGDSADKAKVRAAELEIKQIVSTLELYRADIGRYPTASDGLQALITQPSGSKRWGGPYWKNKELPRDPWDSEYRYVVPGRSGAPFDVISLGSDGGEGGEGYAKDIVSSNF